VPAALARNCRSQRGGGERCDRSGQKRLGGRRKSFHGVPSSVLESGTQPVGTASGSSPAPTTARRGTTSRRRQALWPNDRQRSPPPQLARQFRRSGRHGAGLDPGLRRLSGAGHLPALRLGSLLKVFWGADSDAERPLIALQYRPRGGQGPDPRGAEPLDEAELQASLPELRELRRARQVALPGGRPRIPGTESRLRGYWKDHLDRCRS